MNKKSVNFGNKSIKKSNFYNKNKKIFNTDDIDANKILSSKKEQYDKYNSLKYFIRYNDNDIVRQLYLFISQTTGYINKFDKNRTTMSHMIKDIKLLKTYNKIRKIIEKLMKIDFNSRPIYGDDDDDDDDDDDKCIKTRIRIKTYKDGITTNFYNKNGSKKITEEKVLHKCLSIIILGSVIYAYQKHHTQTFLEEYKYVKEKIKPNIILMKN